MTNSIETSALPGEARRSLPQPKANRLSGIVIALCLLAAFALVGRRMWAVATGPLPPGPGVTAPAIVGATPDGMERSLESLKGKVVVVDFWATWCPPCRAAMPGLQKLHEDLEGEGVVVLGVNQEPGAEARVKRYLEGSGITFESVMDEGDIARRWGVYTFPTTFVVGRDGVIRATYRGPVAEGTLRTVVKDALSS
ncbi:MAG: TlpA disulfide reductase family protein [Deltaproteobacteria bacterium]|jgi:cytochrome c biogenesis protein CcmG/thiol:disulfide interchange protein DsbE